MYFSCFLRPWNLVSRATKWRYISATSVKYTLFNVVAEICLSRKRKSATRVSIRVSFCIFHARIAWNRIILLNAYYSVNALKASITRSKIHSTRLHRMQLCARARSKNVSCTRELVDKLSYTYYRERNAGIISKVTFPLFLHATRAILFRDSREKLRERSLAT